MSILLRGHVRDGRLLIDEPVDLPENTEVQVSLCLGEEQDCYDTVERAQIDAAISAGLAAMARGEVFPAEQVLAEL
jgi:hypothetical protein